MKDKLLYLLLLLLPLHAGAQTFDTVVCTREVPFIWNGQYVSLSGTYQATLTAADGTDSVVTLHVTVLLSPTLIHTSDMTILAGDTVTLAALGADVLIWSDAEGNVLCEDGLATVVPTASTTYYLYGNNLDNLELASSVVNGDFEQGNTGFTSAYSHVNSAGSYALWDEGTYATGANASSYHMNFQNRTDHTTGSGNYMIINGATVPNTNVWTQTVPVMPHTQYAFSVWVCSLTSENLAQLQFSVNGVQVGDIFTAPTVANGWARYYEVWDSEESTTALITILNQNNGQSGNDFGIDDISFSAITTCASLDSVNVTIYNPVTDSTVCDSQLPFYWQSQIVDTAGTYTATIETNSGPKAITLNVTVHPSYLIAATDTICYSQEYNRYGHLVDAPAQGSDAWYATTDYHWNDTLPTVHGCDSLTDIHLTRMGCPNISIVHETDCLTGLSTLTADATVDWGNAVSPAPWLHWSSNPPDGRLDSVADGTTTVVVFPPEKPTVYSLRADYRPTPLCPATAYLQLSPVVPPEARIRVVPEVLTDEGHEFDAYDVSLRNDEDFPAEYQAAWQRRWYIDGEEQASQQSTLHYSIPAGSDADSVTVGLLIFNGECASTAQAVVRSLAVSIAAPNAFTPDEESNNRFHVVSRGVIEGELYVYNRDGLLVYHAADYREGWDGRDADGRPCRQGNYVWLMKFRAVDYPVTQRTRTGTVLLLR